MPNQVLVEHVMANATGFNSFDRADRIRANKHRWSQEKQGQEVVNTE